MSQSTIERPAARGGTGRRKAGWTAADAPSQRGRLAVVTGAGGLGFENALELARAGAEVIIAGRNARKGAEAVARLRREVPAATAWFEHLDLASLGSVADFAGRLRGERESLDILINNAGVMMPPQRRETEDGFELQLGTNYVGHFALTVQLLPLLRRAQGARVVTLSSIAARSGAIHFADLQAVHGYRAMDFYSQSKLACLMFALELQRRSEAGGWGILSMGAHPGIARTELLYNGSGPRSLHGLVRTWLWFLFQPVAQGALPALFAATAAEASGGGYYGPKGFAEVRGAPGEVAIPPQALDREAAERLWQVSERLTGLTLSA